MVLKLKTKANLEWCIRSIERSLCLKYDLKSYPFRRYFPCRVIGKFLPDVTPRQFLSLCAKSKKYHGLIVNGEFFVHPDSILTYVRQHYRRKITMEFMKKAASSLPLTPQK